MSVEDLMKLLASMPPEAKVVISNGPESWSFLQASQINRVTALWSTPAVLLGKPPKNHQIS